MVPELLGPLRRTLIRRADGSVDTTTQVTWLQGPSLYVDVRLPRGDARAVIEGFAGRFTTDPGDPGLARWTRLVDVHPVGPHPDEGRLHPHPEQPGVLVEDGVHDPYVEHWLLPASTGTSPAGGLLAVDDAGRHAVLVRVGDDVGLAVQGPDAAVVALGTCEGDAWLMTSSTEPHLGGVTIAPVRDGDVLHLPPPFARRSWRITESEGDEIVGAAVPATTPVAS